MTKNRAPTPVYLDPGMHSGLEVKGLKPHHPDSRGCLARCTKISLFFILLHPQYPTGPEPIVSQSANLTEKHKLYAFMCANKPYTVLHTTDPKISLCNIKMTDRISQDTCGCKNEMNRALGHLCAHIG